jgi:hypothetical protein
MKRLRDAPAISGKPSACSSSNRAIRSRFSSGVSLAKPKPGSSTMRSSATPADRAISSDRLRNTI